MNIRSIPLFTPFASSSARPQAERTPLG
jgi:hypothetical protein